MQIVITASKLKNFALYMVDSRSPDLFLSCSISLTRTRKNLPVYERALLGCSPGLTAVGRPLTLVWRTERVKKSNEKPGRSNQSTKVEVVVHSRGRSSEYKVQFHFIQAHSCCSAYTPYLPEVLQRGSLWEWLGRTQGKSGGRWPWRYSRETGERENMAGDYSWLGTNIYGHTCKSHRHTL